jgi:hypothetical protein
VEAFVLSDHGRNITPQEAVALACAPHDSATVQHSYGPQPGSRFRGSSTLGRPRGPPHELATFYESPRLDLADTAYGPALVWSTDREHGVVPLCHTHSATE